MFSADMCYNVSMMRNTVDTAGGAIRPFRRRIHNENY